MKILHVINNLTSGGAEKLLTDILPLMRKDGNDVSVAIANSKANISKYETTLKNEGIKIIDFDKSFYNPLLIYRLYKLIKLENYDVVHAHLFPTQYWLAMATYFLTKKPRLVKTEHSVFNERKNYKILRPLEKIIYSRYTSIIAISEEVKTNLSNWLNEKSKIVVINNGVNLNQIELAQNDVSPDFLNPSKKNLLMVARFDFSQKDQITLIEAINFLNNKEDYNLYFIGNGPNMENVKNIVKEKELNHLIFFLGLRTDVYNLMNKVDLNILSTNHEGLSGVTLESLASGKPFLGSDVVGVKEIVPDSTFLFKCKDSRELANKIESIISSPQTQKEMIYRAKDYIKKFDTSYMVKGYLLLYKSLI